MRFPAGDPALLASARRSAAPVDMGAIALWLAIPSLPEGDGSIMRDTQAAVVSRDREDCVVIALANKD